MATCKGIVFRAFAAGDNLYQNWIRNVLSLSLLSFKIIIIIIIIIRELLLSASCNGKISNQSIIVESLRPIKYDDKKIMS